MYNAITKAGGGEDGRSSEDDGELHDFPFEIGGDLRSLCCFCSFGDDVRSSCRFSKW